MAANGRGETSRQPKISPEQQPHFFRIVLKPANGLRIPTMFVRKHGDSLKNKRVVLKVPTGACWPVQLRQIDNNESWLTHGWKEFAAFYGVKEGHLLVFKYEGNYEFNVIIFNKTATEIEYPVGSKHGGDGEDQSVNRRTSQVQKPNEIESHDDDDVSLEILVEIPATARGKRRINRMNKTETCVQWEEDDDVSVEFLGHIPPSSYHDAKRRKTGTIKKACVQPEDDDSIQILGETPAPSSKTSKGRKTRRSRKEADVKIQQETPEDVSSRRHRSRQGITNSEETETPVPSTDAKFRTVAEKAKERFLSFQRAKTFTSANPFFVCFMQPSYVTDKSSLTFPSSFTRENLPKKKFCDLELLVPGERKVWPVNCIIYDRKAQIRHGDWKEFVADNSLHFGDVCVFEMLKGTQMLNVIIYRNS